MPTPDEFIEQSSVSYGGEDFSSHSAASKSKKQMPLSTTLAQREQKAVRVGRLFVLFVLVVVATLVSGAAYFYTYRNEKKAFALQYLDYADKVVDAFLTNAKQRVGLIENLSDDITTYAISSKSNFPFVTIPEFPRRVAKTAALAEMLYIMYLPFIMTNATKTEWEEYSVKHGDWLEEGVVLQEEEFQKEALKRGDTAVGSLWGNREGVLTIPPKVTRLDPPNPPKPYDGPGPFQVIWQVAPAIPLSSFININANTQQLNYKTFNETIKDQQSILGPSTVMESVNGQRNAAIQYWLKHWEMGTKGNFSQGPVADLFVPVFDSFDDETKNTVAIVKGTIYWQMYFTGILPENAHGIICILENSCNQTFTYQIDGNQVRFLGAEDLHDEEYDHLEVMTHYGDFPVHVNYKNNLQTSEASSSVHCDYRIRVYPSQEMEEEFLTLVPIIFTAVLVFVFIFTSLVFILYDLLVERRQRIVMDTAVKSSTVVTSLFPEVVRDRLYDEANNNNNNNNNTTQQGASNEGGITSLVPGIGKSTTDTQETVDGGGMPIAELYENSTIFFADIAGFTNWSSERNPPEVFLLLETVYGAFDKIASKRRVFKVETIGDSYLAVTGLPDPQPDHAIRMAKFAFDCLNVMREVLNDLTDRLGSSTLDLDMRVGLHSGQVTAGVLRGSKARFQLFGDTVNTASRMESLGQKGRVQCSQETADILTSMGKGHWVTPREDKVVAKGKGELQTYWLNPEQASTRRSEVSTGN